ncbi:Gfo/Idh/MocA family protein [Nocardiopsis halotolerans]|uniref:Gfo/Idh/MocA family protein n=1 Tax=Nocardiopsis halotolerans TaxID=124252 RepID=UPI0003483849|nr:Gfo/Idh/MocA family oxidoreductase [Nocardiopsis halotolerans]
MSRGERDAPGNGHTVAIVGCGSMGERHARAIIATDHLEPRLRATHLCDRDTARADRVAALFAQAGLPRPSVTARAEDLFADEGLDSVIVVLPTAAHHEVCVRALRSGKHVLVEKPLALNLEQASAMVGAAERGGRVLSVAENYRRVGANRALRGLLDRSGDVVSMSTDIVCSLGRDTRHNAADWYGDPDIAGAYLAHEMGAHEMDLVRFLLGEVESVYCVPGFPPHEDSRDPRRANGLFALLRCVSGAVVQMNLRSRDDESPGGSRRIVLEDGHVLSGAWEVWDGWHRARDGVRTTTDEVLAAHTDTAESGTDAAAPAHQPLRPLFARDDVARSGTASAVHEFAQAVAGTGTPEIDGVDGARTLALCESLILSARTGVPVFPEDLLHDAGIRL